MFLAFLSWGFLLFLSPYWLANYDIVATFAITTLIVPIFYLKYIIEIHAQKDELEKVLYTTEYAANFDSLTNVPNRKMFKETLKSAIEEKEPFSLLLMDLNKFKAINDNHGHNVGDEVLKEVTRRLNNYIDEDDFLARLGGDEFVIILKQKRAFLNNFLKKMEKNIMGKYKVDGIWVDIQLSVGVSLFPEDGHHEKTLTDNADKAMYVAKKDLEAYCYLYKDIPPNENY
jgi:diguanylate cyclase (GGDEF)-like protein